MAKQEGDLISTEEYQEKKKALAGNRTITRPIMRVDSRGLKEHKKLGRHKKYSPVKFMNMINRYFAWCEENDEIPSIAGMCLHLGFYRDLFQRYARDPLYADIIEQARLSMATWFEQDVYKTKGNCVGKLGYMKNVHGWTEKLESHNTTEVISYTPEEAKARLEMLAPKLLEVLQSNMVLDQIANRNVIEAEVVKTEALQ